MEPIRLLFIGRIVAAAGDEEHGNVSLAQGGRPNDEQVVAPEMPAPGLRNEFQVREGGVFDLLLLGTLPGERCVGFANIGFQCARQGLGHREHGHQQKFHSKNPAAVARPNPTEREIEHASIQRCPIGLVKFEAAGQPCAPKTVATMSLCPLRDGSSLTSAV